MQDRELYHIHLKNNIDKKWQVNNIINVGKNFNSVMSERQKNFSQIIKVEQADGIILSNYSTIIASYFDRIKDLQKIEKGDLKELKSLLEIGYKMSYNADFFKRETALEDFRKDYKNELPSRLHSIYLCDKDGLDYWKDTLSNYGQKKCEIFEVEVDGVVFKTNEHLLPNEVSTYEEMYNKASIYWNPKQKDCSRETNEYLAQGKIKILSKI